MSSNAITVQSTEIAPVNAEVLIQLAIEKNAPVESLERLLAIRRELRAEQARDAYFSALAAFQGACPVIVKDKEVWNKDGRSVRYVYAPMESILRQVGELLLEHGFSYRFETASSDKSVTVTCIASHKEGHSERTSFEAVIDPMAFMNIAQKFGSALTFAKRYALCNAFGIVTGDEDDDARGTEEAGTESSRAKLARLRRDQQARQSSQEKHEPATESPQIDVMTDFLAGLAECPDEHSLNHFAEQALAFPEGPTRDTSKEAVRVRAAELGCTYNKKSKLFERTSS